MAADASSDDLARRLADFLPLPPPPQKQQLSSVAAAVLDAGGRLGRAVGDVFRRFRIDDSFYGDAPQHRRNAGGGSGAAGATADAQSKEGITGSEPIGASGRFARSQGSMNLSATYDSRTNDVESSVVARGDLWRAEASHSSSSAAPRGDGAPLFLIQLGPVLFVRDTTLLFPVHLSKRHLICICPTFGGNRPGMCMELIHSVNENAGVACGYSHTASPSAYASLSIGRSKLNGSAASSGLVLRVDAPLHNLGRPWFSIQMNSGLEF